MASCRRCHGILQRTSGRSTRAALACSLAGLGLLVPGYLLPLIRIPFGGATQELTVVSAVVAPWRDGAPLVAAVLLFMLMIVPVVRLTLLTLVLGSALSFWRLAGAGVMFRWAMELRLWSNLDVFALALGAVFLRLNVQLAADVALGGWALLGAAICSALAVSALDAQTVWRSMGCPPAVARGGVGCDLCQHVSPGGSLRCVRCGRRLERGGTVSATAALVVASLLLYVPCYLYPMSYAIRPTGRSEHTILGGIERLISEGFWAFALLIIVASVMIPALKLLGLGWLMYRARMPRPRGGIWLTRLHRVIHEIGRWSMIDPFIAAGSAGLVHLTDVAEVHVGPSATPFTLVVVLTMLASRRFDPRLVWRSAS